MPDELHDEPYLTREIVGLLVYRVQTIGDGFRITLTNGSTFRSFDIHAAPVGHENTVPYLVIDGREIKP